MLSSRWPRSPSHGKCSRRFCGSSRSYGHSDHQRQRETFDIMHSRATVRRSASKCQGKWPDQTLDQAFGLPEVLVAVSTSRLSCKRAGKTRTLMPVWDSSGESRLNTFAAAGPNISCRWSQDRNPIVFPRLLRFCGYILVWADKSKIQKGICQKQLGYAARKFASRVDCCGSVVWRAMGS